MGPLDLVADRFELERVAGAGGMGTVYRARDRATGRPVALKVLHGQSPLALDRFAREASLLADLRHPGIVGFVMSGVTPDGEPFLVMDWLEGESLSQRLARGPLGVAEACRLGRCVAEALHTAHLRGIVHRDLKPGNVFLPGGDAARPILLDFGIARVHEPGQTLTHTGATLGTPGYMAPEQARGERGVDGRADLFSLGCLIFRCLAGEAPFTGDPLTAMLKAVMEPAPPLAAYRRDVPAPLDALVRQLLEKRADARPPDAASVARALAAIEAGAPAALLPAPAGLGAPSPAAPPLTTPAPSGVYPPAPGAPTWVGAAATPTGARWWIPLLALGGLVALAALSMGLLYAFQASVGSGLPLRPPLALPCGGVRCADVTYPDPERVDPMALLPRATQLAREVDRSAAFAGMIIRGVQDGTIALGNDPLRPRPTTSLLYRFATGRSGKGLNVIASPGRLVVLETEGVRPVSVPTCTLRAAYRAAVAGGLPRGLLDMFVADDGAGHAPWIATPPGAGTLRIVDGRTCAVSGK